MHVCMYVNKLKSGEAVDQELRRTPKQSCPKSKK